MGYSAYIDEGLILVHWFQFLEGLHRWSLGILFSFYQSSDKIKRWWNWRRQVKFQRRQYRLFTGKILHLCFSLSLISPLSLSYFSLYFSLFCWLYLSQFLTVPIHSFFPNLLNVLCVYVSIRVYSGECVYDYVCIKHEKRPKIWCVWVYVYPIMWSVRCGEIVKGFGGT